MTNFYSYDDIEAECKDREESNKRKRSLDEIIGREYDNAAMEIYNSARKGSPSSALKEEGVRYLNEIISNIDQDILRLSIYLHSLGYPSENMSFSQNDISGSMKNKITELLRIKHRIVLARDTLMIENVSE